MIRLNESAIIDITEQNVAILGITGSGKSNTAAVLAEQLLDDGQPVIILDIADEYHGLRSKYDLLMVGPPHSVGVDLVIEDYQLDAFAKLVATKRFSVIFNIKFFRRADDRMAYIARFLDALWWEFIRLEAHERGPYRIFFDEAHNYFSQSGASAATDICKTIASEGRKFGLNSVIISQRATRIHKDILSQCGTLLLHEAKNARDLVAYWDNLDGAFMGDDEISKAWMRKTVRALSTGEALVYDDSEVRLVQVDERITPHGGHAPGSNEQPIDRVAVDKDLIKQLQDTLASTKKPTPADDPMLQWTQQLESQLTEVIAERDDYAQQLADAHAEIKVLKDRIETWEGLKVNVQVQQPNQQTIDAVSIGRMDADQMAVGQVNFPHVVPRQPEQSASSPRPTQPQPVEKAAERGEYRSELAINRQRNAQERAFSKVLDRAKNLRKPDRIALSLMLDNETTSFDRTTLGERTGYSSTTIRPAEIVRTGLAQKHRKGRYAVYSCYHTRRILDETYPLLDRTEMIERIQEALV